MRGRGNSQPHAAADAASLINADARSQFGCAQFRLYPIQWTIVEEGSLCQFVKRHFLALCHGFALETALPVMGE